MPDSIRVDSSNPQKRHVMVSKRSEKVVSHPFGTDIIDCIELPILVMNRDCTVASFNPAAATLLLLTPSDVGRPLRGIQLLADIKNLEEICEHVIAGGTSSHWDVRDDAGSWYSLRIGPCKASNQNIAGAILTFTNVTAFRASLEQAIYEREYTKAIINTVIDPLIVLDENFRVKAANQAFYTMFQTSREATQDARLYELGKPDWDIPRLRTLLNETQPTDGQPEALEVDHEFPAIGRRTLLLNARPLSRGGHLGRMTLVAIQDITDRKQAEQAVRRQSAQFQTLLNNAPMGVYLVDADFRIREVNPTALPVFGDIPDLIGRDFDEVIHLLWTEEYADELVRIFRNTLETGEPYEAPEQIEHRIDRGVIECYEWRINRIPLPEGRYGVVCYFRDISVQVQTRVAIAESAERLRFMAESMPQKIFTARPNGDIDYLNQQWTEFTGLSFKEIKEGGWIQFVHPDDAEENIRCWLHSIQTGEPFQFEHRFRRSDGVYRWHLTRAHALRDAQGKVQMWIGSNTDVDDIKKTEEVLRQKTEEAQEASRIKSQFVSNVSHELRTPINGIMGYGHLLLTETYGAIGETQRSPLEGILRNARDLSNLINDLLDLSRIEAGKMPIYLEWIDLPVLLKEIVAGMNPLLTQKGLHAQVDFENGIPQIHSDPGKIKQIVTNFLSNSVKFTSKGGIYLSARELPDKKGIEFSVRDTGIGIRSEDLPKIFDAFHQIDGQLTREYGGVGLGLTIVKELIKLLRGEVRVESHFGKGTTCTIFLPYELEDALHDSN